MKKIPLIFLISSTVFLIGAFYYSMRVTSENTQDPFPKKESSVLVKKEDGVLVSRKILDVPYVSEAPEGIWKQPWANACEEASIAMVDLYYQKKGEPSILEAKKYLQSLFEKEDVLFGTSRNASGQQIVELVNSKDLFFVKLKINPTIEDIKKEIIDNHPVISLHRGFDLENKNIGFSPTKSSYHTLVVVGFDDDKKVFITHDPGDEVEGKFFSYSYDTFMKSLHDYDALRDKADGTPTVILTSAV